MLFDLPRHCRNVHKIDEQQARHVRCNFGLRKEWTKVNCETAGGKKEKNKSVRKLCSYPGCHATPIKIHNHLRQTHKLDRHSREYRQYLIEALRLLPDNDEKPIADIGEEDADEIYEFQMTRMTGCQQKWIMMY